MWVTKLLSTLIKTSLRTWTVSLMVLPSNVDFQLKFPCNVSILAIPNSPGVWWWKRDSKVTFSIYDIMMTATKERFFNAWITIMLGLDVKIRSMQEDEWFVKWVCLSIMWVYPTVDVMVSSFFPTLSLVSKEYHFEISSNYWNCWI